MKEFHLMFKRILLYITFLSLFTSSSVFAQSFTVGLYPWVPRVDQFKEVLTIKWKALHPEDTLVFMTPQEWDGGYDVNPSKSMDVYVFDAINMNYFSAQGWLLPLSAQDIAEVDDFVPYAISGVKNGASYWGIPQLGCTNILFYDKRDTALANASTLNEIKATLGTCRYTSQIPPERYGLMFDMAGSTTNANLYLDAEHSMTNIVPVPQPTTASSLDDKAIANLQNILKMASYFNATISPDGAYDRATWFSQGYGRAVVGFTESMSAMNQKTLDNIDFKVMPFSDTTSSRPFFYSDVIGIFPKTDRSKEELARVKELANFMASTEYMVASSKPQGSATLPQYLMPVRSSVFTAMKSTYPIYARMQTLLKNSNPTLFTMDANSKAWIASMAPTIETKIRAKYPCGCDFNAGPIPNNKAAPQICNALCATHGGWNGQWTTTVPGTTSVCGCNQCEISP